MRTRTLVVLAIVVVVVVVATAVSVVTITGNATSNLSGRVSALAKNVTSIDDRVAASETSITRINALANKNQKAIADHDETLNVHETRIGRNETSIRFIKRVLATNKRGVASVRAAINREITRVSEMEDAALKSNLIAFRVTGFSSGSSDLAEIKTQLDATIVAMSKEDLVIKSITGHTDLQGKPEDNQKLSLERAQTVYDYLSDVKCLKLDNVTVTGKGETSKYPGQNRCIVIVGEYTSSTTAQ